MEEDIARRTQIEKPIDIYRDTPIRLLGYANEVGEAFRSNVPVKYVNLSYGIATLYCLADTADKSITSLKSKNTTTRQTLITAGDTLTWQLLASVIVPGFTINRLCTLSKYVLKSTDLVSSKARHKIIPLIGLASIPLIIKPIDHAIDYLMDNTVRKFY